jgi:hypothetical protein
MRRLILPALVFAGLFSLQGCAIYKDKNGATHIEALPPPAAVYVAPPPPVYVAPPPAYYPYPAPYYGPYYYPGGYYHWR